MDRFEEGFVVSTAPENNPVVLCGALACDTSLRVVVFSTGVGVTISVNDATTYNFNGASGSAVVGLASRQNLKLHVGGNGSCYWRVEFLG